MIFVCLLHICQPGSAATLRKTFVRGYWYLFLLARHILGGCHGLLFQGAVWSLKSIILCMKAKSFISQEDHGAHLSSVTVVLSGWESSTLPERDINLLQVSSPQTLVLIYLPQNNKEQASFGRKDMYTKKLAEPVIKPGTFFYSFYINLNCVLPLTKHSVVKCTKI